MKCGNLQDPYQSKHGSNRMVATILMFFNFNFASFLITEHTAKNGGLD